ncbi:histone deacetylase 8-like [Anthonomus grandis grandis]|uniref:histone deacetylase 8-like n=1 Tax=Anthonomus grandis grandis TaxID=2921223 RepID=UPI002165E8CF|nr:histone deacetylase 8-like [Anthonomus grandis grandis]
MLKDKIVYIYNTELIKQCDKLPSMSNRASIVQDLISSYNLLSHQSIVAVQSENATEDELLSFHASDYVNMLKSLNSFDTNMDDVKEEHLEYGLGYDCPILNNIFDFVSCVTGSSVSGAKLLAAEKCKTVINWFGGWHHSQRDSASGFCYANDIVIAIQLLYMKFERILYVDLDIHHGDGVQNAFQYSNKVLTLSYHKYCPGFFPNTGNIDDIGAGKGKYFSLNIPLKEGVSDKTYIEIFSKTFPLIYETFKPKALVVQCGADGLNEDPIGESNLTLNGIGTCIKTILGCDIPTLFLGGGGYNLPNTARLWTYLTSLIVNQELENDIPDSSKYFCEYGPSFELHIAEGRKKDHNTTQHINSMVEKITYYCDLISKS